MKLCVLQLQFGGGHQGGVAGYISEIVKRQKPGFRYIVTVDNKHIKYLRERKTYGSSSLVPVSSSYNIFKFLSMVFLLRKMLIKQKIDLIHCHTLRSGFLCFFLNALTGVKYIYTNHGLRFTQKNGLFLKSFFLILERLTIERASFVVCIRKADMRLARKIFIKQRHKIKLIRTRIDQVDEFKGQKRRSERGGLQIIGVGSMLGVKRIDRFIKVLSILEWNKIPYNAFWLGDGPIRPAIEAEILEKGVRLELFGHCSKKRVISQLRNADLFLLTSEYETMPLAALEAMSLGIPCVLSEYFGVRELIRGESNGFVINFKKLDSLWLGRQFKRYLDDVEYWERSSKASLSVFLSDFSGSHHMVTEYEKYYNRTL
ncbi:glycosyltransferase [Alphaproteobacteria bacterium]|nr:glycosyltransferase [Alphaproteobacteria bacterium]